MLLVYRAENNVFPRFTGEFRTTHMFLLWIVDFDFLQHVRIANKITFDSKNW